MGAASLDAAGAARSAPRARGGDRARLTRPLFPTWRERARAPPCRAAVWAIVSATSPYLAQLDRPVTIAADLTRGGSAPIRNSPKRNRRRHRSTRQVGLGVHPAGGAGT